MWTKQPSTPNNKNIYILTSRQRNSSTKYPFFSRWCDSFIVSGFIYVLYMRNERKEIDDFKTTISSPREIISLCCFTGGTIFMLMCLFVRMTMNLLVCVLSCISLPWSRNSLLYIWIYMCIQLCMRITYNQLSLSNTRTNFTGLLNFSTRHRTHFLCSYNFSTYYSKDLI